MSLHAMLAEAKLKVIQGALKTISVVYYGTVKYTKYGIIGFGTANTYDFEVVVYQKYNPDLTREEAERIKDYLTENLPKCMEEEYPTEKVQSKSEFLLPGSNSFAVKIRAEYAETQARAGAREEGTRRWKRFKYCVKNLCKDLGYKVKVVKQKVTYQGV